MRKSRQDLGFLALKVEGGILPSEFIQKIVALGAKGQRAQDYLLPKGPTLKDEIGRAWRIGCAEWRDFQETRHRQDISQRKLGVDSWLTTLLKVILGHDDLHQQGPEHKGERTFPITHKSIDGAVPLVLTTHDHELERSETLFGDESRKRSAYALMQEFLNAKDECLWGIVSNGLIIRLLRDNPSLTRPAFIEADLERIFEEQLYADFAAMWLIFHGSRFKSHDADPKNCIMEHWRTEGQETGERALANLRNGVKTALLELGCGFLKHSSNESLRTALTNGSLNSADFFRELLRLVYRMLFLLCVEDRDSLHPSNTPEAKKALYLKGYSISRLRECALLRRNYDSYADMWEGLRISFQSLSNGMDSLGLPALGGLFRNDKCPFIDECQLENQFLLRAMFALSFFRSKEILARVNYRDMGSEELGSVYESLLELHAFIDVTRHPWTFEFLAEGDGGGSERKISGSYYTPESLVNELIRNSIDPVIETVRQKNSGNPREAILKLKVIDPACGSGHFLLAAARRLAIEVAKLDSGNDSSEESTRRHALREVVQHCIYGVDRNPLAVELCKTALWIETVEPGKPLSFLDSHIRCGDSLVGIMKLSEMDSGIPDEAYDPVSNDDKAIAKELRRRNKIGKAGVIQGSLFNQKAFEPAKTASLKDIEDMPEESIEQIEAKSRAFFEANLQPDRLNYKLQADIFVGAYFAEKSVANLDKVPLTEDLLRAKQGLEPRPGLKDTVQSINEKFRFFHWPVEFMEIFNQGGFDVVLGNPPWERIKLQEKEFFGARSPDIAKAVNKSGREKLIKALFSETASPAEEKLKIEFHEAKRGADAASVFVRTGGRFPLCGRGDINTYAVFAESMIDLVAPLGRVGCIVPSGIATDETTKLFFHKLIDTKRLRSLHDFENRAGLFPAVDGRMRFVLLTVSGAMETNASDADFVFFAQTVDDLKDEDRHFTLTSADFQLLNPNSRTCPIFRSKHDAELAKSIYSRIPVLVREGDKQINSWSLKFTTMFHMTNDAVQFLRSREQLEAEGFDLSGNVFVKGSEKWMPVIEGKMVGMYDHRAANIELKTENALRQQQPSATTLADHLDPKFSAMPYLWGPEAEGIRRTPAKWNNKWFPVFKRVTASTNERTLIGCIIPWTTVSYTLYTVTSTNHALKMPYLLANFCSFVSDYLIRQKTSQSSLPMGVVYETAILGPDVYDAPAPWAKDKSLAEWLKPRVLELSYTAWELEAFANDFGFTGPPFKWDEQRRFELKCEIDAAFFVLYGVSRSDVEHILDSFTAVKRKDHASFGTFRTLDSILKTYDSLSLAKAKSGNPETIPIKSS